MRLGAAVAAHARHLRVPHQFVQQFEAPHFGERVGGLLGDAPRHLVLPRVEVGRVRVVHRPKEVRALGMGVGIALLVLLLTLDSSLRQRIAAVCAARGEAEDTVRKLQQARLRHLGLLRVALGGGADLVPGAVTVDEAVVGDAGLEKRHQAVAEGQRGDTAQLEDLGVQATQAPQRRRGRLLQAGEQVVLGLDAGVLRVALQHGLGQGHVHVVLLSGRGASCPSRRLGAELRRAALRPGARRPRRRAARRDR